MSEFDQVEWVQGDEALSGTNCVLVIDDDVQLRRSLTRFLERGGHEVLEAADGEVAVRRLAHNRVDVVVCDVFMPGMNGFDFLMTVRDQFPDVRIIMMSGGGEIGQMPVLEAATKLGASAVFAKPFRMQAMLDAIEADVSTSTGDAFAPVGT